MRSRAPYLCLTAANWPVFIFVEAVGVGHPIAPHPVLCGHEPGLAHSHRDRVPMSRKRGIVIHPKKEFIGVEESPCFCCASTLFHSRRHSRSTHYPNGLISICSERRRRRAHREAGEIGTSSPFLASFLRCF